MLTEAIKLTRISLVLLFLMTLLTGFIYPGLIALIANILFPHQAQGSFIQNQYAGGSELIGQWFTDPKYFWGRPSATTPFPYNASSSTGSNLGPSNPALFKAVKERIDTLRKADPTNVAPIPIDLVTASGSGLDPELSPEAIFYQVPRVAKARGFDENKIHNLVKQHIQDRQLKILGEPRVNVLRLNLALDALQKG